jgi:hypothetical protein
VVATAGRALTAATPRSGRPSAFIARPSAAFGKSVGQYVTPHNVMGSRCVAEDADGEEAMKDSGTYRVTHHRGRRSDSEDAEVIFSYPDEEPARRFYQRRLPPRVGYVLALWRPDGTLIASTIGPQRDSRSSA